MNSFLATVITSSITATIVGALINAWIDFRKSKLAARFDALAAAVALEGFAITCAEKISAHKVAVDSKGASGSLLGSVPQLPQLTAVAGFIRPKKASIANRILVFPQEVTQADQSVAFWWDVVGDADAMHAEAKLQVSKLGLRSLDLARDIRTEFDLPMRRLVFGEFNIRELLAEPQTRGSISTTTR